MMRRTRLSFCQLQKRILTTGGIGTPTYIPMYWYIHIPTYISLPTNYLTAYLLSLYLTTISLPTYSLLPTISTYLLSLSIPTISLPTDYLSLYLLYIYLLNLYLSTISLPTYYISTYLLYLSLYLTSPICHGETRLYS